MDDPELVFADTITPACRVHVPVPQLDCTYPAYDEVTDPIVVLTHLRPYASVTVLLVVVADPDVDSDTSVTVPDPDMVRVGFTNTSIRIDPEADEDNVGSHDSPVSVYVVEV